MNSTIRRFGVLVALVLVATLLAACPSSPPPDPNRTPNPVGPSPTTASRALAVEPAIQQTPVWCWATSAEMVFRYYRLPNVNPAGNYQCGIVAAWFGMQCFLNCGLCQFAVGPMSNMHQVITGYGGFLLANGVASRSLSALLIFRPLSMQEIRTEIDSGRPVVIGIAPGGGFALPNASQHIAVLIGYDTSRGVDEVIVNDPYPFDAMPLAHPYLAVGATRLAFGQFRLQRSALVNALNWANTIYGIQ